MYSVKYKMPSWWFFRTITNIQGDGILEITGGRFFIQQDGTRLEFPKGLIYKFGKERVMQPPPA